MPADKLTPGPLGALVDVQNRAIEHYFRLQQMERKLSRAAGRRKFDTGRNAIRQIELERQRLGRELHTGIGQMLAATRLQLETIEQQWPSPPPAVQQALKRIGELAGQALDQVRAVSRRLHPPEWQHLTLPEALRQLWELSGLPERTQARFTVDPGVHEPDLESKILLYRAMQETLSNVARHARASAVEVSLFEREGRLVLSVRDNGVGFDAAGFWNSPPSLNAGIGLRSIREQAAAIGGGAQVESGPQGTTVEVWTPEEPIPVETS